jgi:very-short-patch-repair endonuclease
MRSTDLIEKAKTLRTNQTDAELALWYGLRGRQVKGLKFRRQEAIGKYIVDFISFEAKLIIEVDGSQHFDHQQYDDARTKYLESLGFKVLRFWNNEVLETLDSVLEKIYQVVEVI